MTTGLSIHPTTRLSADRPPAFDKTVRSCYSATFLETADCVYFDAKVQQQRKERNMSRNEKIFWTILAVLVSAVLCVGGYKLYKQLDSFKTEVATDKAERAACLAREQVLSVAEANLSRDLAAKTKAYDQKKAYWCPLYGLPEGE